ncbi:hypothetical protein P7K49_037692 [Saguinus oedipus]|uniref:Uncharacterized protein n=1 Tax=Saguinus oedipus TaxID=9490 RepID=A0ABQ9TIU7_SAGOE|nr:hypothetical protein P7K49_037692 [Saguinus oedipus]
MGVVTLKMKKPPAISEMADQDYGFFSFLHFLEEMLQYDAPIIKEIAHMHHVTVTKLLELQGHIMKSIEEKWFKEYQDLFPLQEVEVQSEVQPSSRKPLKTVSTLLQESQKKGWLRMISFIRSFCKYRRFMSNPSKRQEFEDYLHQEMQNSKENFTSTHSTLGRSAPPTANIRSADQENGETTLVKRRIFGHRIITVNFVINDLYFFSEMEKFNDLVSSAHTLQVNRVYNKNDVILMRSKINIIQKLFLNSDIPPKLRVNVSESQKDAILAAVSEGYLDRSIFHGAIMSVFPVIMYFWKSFIKQPYSAKTHDICHAAVSCPGTKIILHQKREEVNKPDPQQRQIIAQRLPNTDRTFSGQKWKALVPSSPGMMKKGNGVTAQIWQDQTAMVNLIFRARKLRTILNSFFRLPSHILPAGTGTSATLPWTCRWHPDLTLCPTGTAFIRPSSPSLAL